MRELVWTVVAMLMLPSTAHADSKRGKRPVKPCVVAVTMAPGKLTIDGVELPDYQLTTLVKVLGKPDRTEKVTSKQRYEEWGVDGMPPSSTMVTITDVHYVYDTRGLVFSTKRSDQFDKRDAADGFRVFFANQRKFDHVAAPPVLPKQRGGCRLEINGVVVDPKVDLRPASITYRTDEVVLFKTKFGPTSSAMKIDGLYSIGGDRSVHIFLDAPATGRASYVELR